MNFITAEAYHSGNNWLLTKAGISMDAIQAARWYNKEHAVHVDWHIFSDLFVEFVSLGQAQRTGYTFDGFIEYVITV